MVYFFCWQDKHYQHTENYNQEQASSLITKPKQGGQLPKSKEPKKLQDKDHLARVWAAILACLGTQETEALESEDNIDFMVY